MESYSSHTCFCLISPSLDLPRGAALHRAEREPRPGKRERQLILDRQSSLCGSHILVQQAVATSLIDPFCASWTGSRLGKEVTVHLTLNRPQRLLRLSRYFHQYTSYGLTSLHCRYPIII
jgi:hypothetical protein